MIKTYYQKQPSEQETVKISFSRRMASLVVSGYAIYSVEVKVYDSEGTDVSSTMVEGTPSFSGTDVYATIKAGTSGASYYARVKVTATKDGAVNQILEEDLLVRVVQDGVS